MQQLVDACMVQLTGIWGCPVRLHRTSPIVSIADNYDRLRYPPEGIARDARYTRYLCDVAVLRTHTSSMIPPLLSEIASSGEADVLLACPGMVYRRDCIDRWHTGEPHQMDLWRIRRDPSGEALGTDDLRIMIGAVIEAVLPGRIWRAVPAEHPYTVDGLQIDVREGTSWVEVGECGRAHPEILGSCGLREHSGLAMGLGLDRLLMLRKGIDDIRILRATDPRMANQMLDLEPYRPVSTMPPIRRDLSIAVRDETTAEELGDRVRAALGARADSVESVEVLRETPYDIVPMAAHARMGMIPGQKNVLLRVVLRDVARTLTHAEANDLRNDVYMAVHEGSHTEYTRATNARMVVG